MLYLENYLRLMKDITGHEVPDGACLDLIFYDLNRALSKLSRRYQSIVRLRYGLRTGQTIILREVAAEFNLSTERIRQIIIRAKALCQDELHEVLPFYDGRNVVGGYNRVDILNYCEAMGLVYSNGQPEFRDLGQELLESELELRDLRKLLQLPLVQRRGTDVSIEMPIEELGLSMRAYNSLRRRPIGVVGDLLQWTSDELLAIYGFGIKSLDDVIEALADYGWCLK
jgi:hypothetical protein